MRRTALWAVSVWICGWGTLSTEVALAGHISGGFLDILRPPMQKEGYLNFRTTGHGEEYTGHTDRTGRDHADNWITVRPIRLIDSDGVKPTKAEEPDIDADFEFIRKIYAQAGIAVRREATVEQNMAVKWANFDIEARATAANAQNNTGGVMNLFYAKEFDIAGANGLSVSPNTVGQMTPGGITFNRPYSFVRDVRANNTSAHELGHQLLNGNSLWKQADPATESTDKTNLMFLAGTESSADLDDVGQRLSPTVGGHDILEHQKDGVLQEQLARIHENGGPRNGVPAFVQHANYHDTHGDRADFDWVSDQRLIETLAAGGNGADHGAGIDFMVWEIADILASKHIGPDKDPHFHGLGELVRPRFNGLTFKSIDVFSNINRYADNDIDPATGAVSDTSKALDYLMPQFSTDMTNWVSGELVNVFVKGWNPVTAIDNYVARWTTDIDAKFVRVSAAGVGIVGHDGNTQIDAIIASAGRASPVPEPGTIVLAGIGGGLLLMRARLSRRRR